MMGIVSKLIVFILTLCPVAINSSFEYFTFVQVWPHGFCTLNFCERNPIPTVFTIHGNWPGNFTRRLQNCGGPDYTPLRTLADWNNRNLRWPDIRIPLATQQTFQQTRFQSFWRHEWDAHGTCSANMYPEATYFSRTIQLSQTHDILNYLATGNIRPGSNPTVSSVTSTISRAINNRVPDLWCVNPPFGTSRVLVEVGICFAPDMSTIIDCPSQFLRTWTCGTSTISFPATSSRDFNYSLVLPD